MRFTFGTEFVSPHVTRVLTPLGDCVYLVEGADRALLLDTGYGIGDLRGYVESLLPVGKPVDVVLTHGHFDHVGGASQWERVWLSPLDAGVERRHGTRENRLRQIRALPGGPELGLGEGDLCPQFSGELLELRDGQRFDLGGVTVRILAVPGHTPGMVVPLAEEDRVAVFGDACGEFTLLCFPESLPVADYHQSLLRLKELDRCWDTVVRNHGTHVSPKDLLDRNIWLCERVLAGTDDRVSVEMFGAACYAASNNQEPGVHGNVIYRQDEPAA